LVSKLLNHTMGASASIILAALRQKQEGFPHTSLQ
jgi:hypothetical protein